MDTALRLQRNNYFRLLRFLLDVGTDVFREVFKKRFPTVSSYGNIIEPNRYRIERLVLGQQRDILFPSGFRYRGDLSDINISTLYTLLRNIGNICPHNIGWGKDPEETDRSLSANIERIRNVRNTIEHLTSAALPEDQFNKLWECLRTAILEIGGQTYADRIDELLVLPIDEEAERYYLERLESLQSENKDMIGRISRLEELTSHLGVQPISFDDDPEIVTRREDLNRFVVTSSATKALELLQQNQVLLLHGKPGSGKSISALYVAYTLYKRDKYTFHFSIEPSDILKYKNDDKKHIFIFDDVCGTVHTNQYNTERWKTYKSVVKEILLKKSTIKILLISRTLVNVFDLFRNVFGTTQKEVEIINSLKERKKIANEYLKNNEIAKVDDKTIELFSFFPLLCRLFSNRTDPQLSIETFFKQPSKCIERELKDMQFNSNACFFALCLLVISNRSVNKKFLQDCTKEIIESLVTELKVDVQITWQSLESSFQQMVGTYVSESSTSFTCLHDAMFDIIAKFVGEKIPRTILQYCHTYLLRDQVQLGTTCSNSSDLIIVLSKEYQGLYMERMVNEVRKGFYSTAFDNQMTKQRRFRSQFITFIEERITSLDLLFESQFEPSLLVVLSIAGYMDFITFFTSDKQELLQDKSGLEKCLYFASIKGNTEVVRFLLKYEFNRDSCICETTALIAASRHNQEDIVALLIQNGSNVNSISMLKVSALHAACLSGALNICNLLVNRGASVNLQDMTQNTPLHYACASGNIKIVRLLVKKHADINSKNLIDETPLHFACMNGHTDIVKYLVNQGTDISKSSFQGFKAIHYASYSNEPKLIGFLLDQGVDINEGNLTSAPPLTIACKFHSTDVIKVLINRGVSINCRDTLGCTSLFYVKGVESAKILVSHGIDINTLDFCHYSALHAQCCFGNIDIIEYLLKLKMNINEGHFRSETPLHVACSMGRKNVVDLLLNNLADINSLTSEKNTPLHTALMNEHFEIVEMLLDRGANIFRKNSTGFSILHAACCSGNLHIVNRLLKENIEVDNKNINGVTALAFATSHNHKDIVETLIEHSADVHINLLGLSLLHLSIVLKNIEITDMLITAGASVNVQSSDWKMYPLHDACRLGNTKLVKLLIRNKALIDGRNKELETPLHRAAYHGYPDVVKDLLKYGASIFAEDENGNTALHHAVLNTKTTEMHETVVQILIENGIQMNKKNKKDNFTALHIASGFGYASIVELLVSHHAEIDCFDIEKITPLHLACISGHKTTVQLLLNHFANVSLSNPNGFIPLHVACSGGYLDILDLLIKHGTDVTVTATKGYTGLYLACTFGHLRIVERLLIESKCIKLIDKSQIASISPFHTACKFRQVAVVKILSNYPIDFASVSKRGRNCLHFACQSGQVKLVEFLVGHQPDVNCQSVKGDTPLHWACFLGHFHIVEFLLKHGANINVGRETYFTPLHAACFAEHLDIVRLLINQSANVKAKTKSGKTVLEFAYRSGNTALINLVNTNIGL